MNVSWQAPDAVVTAALEKCDGVVRTKGPAAWSLSLVNGRAFDVAATADGDRQWLLLDAPAESPLDAHTLWRVLSMNAALSGVAKFGLGRSGLRLRAELPIERRATLAARLAGTCAGFKAALDGLEGRDAVAEPEPETAESGIDLAAPCREAGWEVTTRANGTLAVDLGCRRGFCQALVAPRSGGTRVWSELASWHALADRSREAMAWLLLETSALVRFARGAADSAGGRVRVHLEVMLDASPEASDLDHALSALAAGCALVGEEVRAVANETVAERYLDIRTTLKT